ncbi:transcriptional regulator family: Fungal Specific TF [Penicillium paradoxum]|uniref:transcriptional regulator family: Fungal Specific TF n=1 Tax=Penicillium paradoxum TaxID=176176 RepID=UPI002548E482|nr:transcriptional regulator family: Fungal Specific TF [Penicillium paradoxum]KAJ5779358.1 transcriptional regulator family: Fungal Specific TF [Penicillium paradoxum]
MPVEYYPPSSLMGTTSDPGFVSGETPETAAQGEHNFIFDPATDFWALNSEFTFQAPFLADFNVDRDNWDMGM